MTFKSASTLKICSVLYLVPLFVCFGFNFVWLNVHGLNSNWFVNHRCVYIQHVDCPDMYELFNRTFTLEAYACLFVCVRARVWVCSVFNSSTWTATTLCTVNYDNYFISEGFVIKTKNNTLPFTFDTMHELHTQFVLWLIYVLCTLCFLFFTTKSIRICSCLRRINRDIVCMNHVETKDCFTRFGKMKFLVSVLKFHRNHWYALSISVMAMVCAYTAMITTPNYKYKKIT